MRRKIFLLVALSMFIFFGCTDEGKTSFSDENKASEKEVEKKSTKKSDDLVLTTLDDEKISIVKEKDGVKFSNQNNRVILLNFFATWCPPCKAEIPHLNSLQEKYRDDLLILSVALEDKDVETLLSFKEFYNINYTITHGMANFKFSELLGGVQTIPYMVLYDKDGKYLKHYNGIVPEEMLEADISRQL